MFKKIPHTYTIIGTLLVLCAILSWIIPAGEYVREVVTVGGSSKELIVDNSYHHVERDGQSWQIFTSFIEGFQNQSAIIVFLLIIGGAFHIVNETRSIDNGIRSFLAKVNQWGSGGILAKIGAHNIVIALVTTLFSLFGAIFGMSEETLAFVVLIVPLAISMGYDSLTGISMVYVGAHVGFAGAMLNPFTIGIAQGLSNLPLFSGIGYRIFCWTVLTGLTVIAILVYAASIKKNPEGSMTYKLDGYWRNRVAETASHENSPAKRSAYLVYGILSIVLGCFAYSYPISQLALGNATFTLPLLPIFLAGFLLLGGVSIRHSAQNFILVQLLFTILFLIIGVLAYGWYIAEIGALFLALGIFAGYTMGFSNNKIIENFLTGAKDMLSAALVVALAGGIIQLLQDGRIIDTILHSLATLMSGASKLVSIGVMYFIQTMINIIIPSGSAKAALTMPIMAPFSDVIDISRQATVMAFQFGDGFTNMITPSSAVLMGALGIARIPYELWIRWFWKYLLALVILGYLLLVPTVTMPLAGF